MTAQGKRIKKNLTIPLDPQVLALVQRIAEIRDQPCTRVVRRLLMAGIEADGWSLDPLSTTDPALAATSEPSVTEESLPSPEITRPLVRKPFALPPGGEDRF